jgi:hypothetical protein
MSELLNALRRNLASMESIGDEDNAKILRKRIADEEKAPVEDVEVVDATAFNVDPDPAAEVVEYGDMTKAELLDLATAADIEGRHGMNKAELVEALEGTN